MAILGLTVNEEGEAIQRLAITTKVSIGEILKSAKGNTYPSKIDHFRFLRKGKALEWEPDPEFTKHYTENCREFEIILLDDEIENVFRTELAWWSAAEKKCSGDGQSAFRKTAEHPEGQDWSPCGSACPNYDKECKPSADLYFILADFPRLGSVCRLHTGGKRSIAQVYSALKQIQTVTGGRLAGIRCKLAVRPEKTSFRDAKDGGKKKSTTIYGINIEISASDMRLMIANMTEHAKLFEQTRKLLGDGRKVEYVVDEESEEERAPDVAQEFYPDAEALEAAKAAEAPKSEIKQPKRKAAEAAQNSFVPKAVIPPPFGAAATAPAGQLITKDQRMEFFRMCMDQGWSNDQVKDILNSDFHFASSKDITTDKYEAVIQRFRTPEVVEPEEVDIEDEDLLNEVNE